MRSALALQEITKPLHVERIIGINTCPEMINCNSIKIDIYLFCSVPLTRSFLRYYTISFASQIVGSLIVRVWKEHYMPVG